MDAVTNSLVEKGVCEMGKLSLKQRPPETGFAELQTRPDAFRSQIGCATALRPVVRGSRVSLQGRHVMSRQTSIKYAPPLPSMASACCLPLSRKTRFPVDRGSGKSLVNNVCQHADGDMPTGLAAGSCERAGALSGQHPAVRGAILER